MQPIARYIWALRQRSRSKAKVCSRSLIVGAFSACHRLLSAMKACSEGAALVDRGEALRRRYRRAACRGVDHLHRGSLAQAGLQHRVDMTQDLSLNAAFDQPRRVLGAGQAAQAARAEPVAWALRCP